MSGRRRAALVLAACAAVAVVPAGCGREPPRATPTTAGPAPSLVSPAASDPAPTSPASRPDLVLAFGGDVHFTGRTARLLRNPGTAVGPLAKLLAAADLAVVNLETAVTTRGTPEPKEFHFRAPASAYSALRAAGVDAASLANNHALDYGRVGLADTLEAAHRNSFPVFGAGRDVTEAYAPRILTVRGVRVALLGFSQIHSLADRWAPRADRSGVALAWNVQRATAAVAQARQDANLVVVFNHWGQERNGCPTADQRLFARRLAAAGADLIIGAHAHVLQGDGWLGPAYVAYGLGNFVWYVGNADTAVLRLTVRDRQVIRREVVPAVVSGTGQPARVTGSAAAGWLRRYDQLRRCSGLSPAAP